MSKQPSPVFRIKAVISMPLRCSACGAGTGVLWRGTPSEYPDQHLCDACLERPAEKSNATCVHG